MTNAVHRIGDIDDDFPPNTTTAGSSNVFANSIGI